MTFETRESQILSLIIHGTLVLPFFWFSSESENRVMVSQVELLSGKSSRPYRKKMEKGQRVQLPPDPSKKAPQVSVKERGMDPRDQREQLASSGQSGVRNQYALDLQAYIEKYRTYPRRALVMGFEGDIVVRLKILSDGRFDSVVLESRSRHSILNKAALKLIRRLKKFRPPPPSFGGRREFLVPIKYQIDGSAGGASFDAIKKRAIVRVDLEILPGNYRMAELSFKKFFKYT